MFIGSIGCALGKSFGGCSCIKPMPKYPLFRKTWQDVKGNLDDLGLICMESSLPDYEFFYTDILSWQVIFKNLIYPAQYFAEIERKDCDDYSKKASADSSFYYGLNCLQVWGDTPEGYHAFNMIMIAPGIWRVFEPNAGFECAGELLLLDNKYGWKPKQWKA